jgi:hypothetical protein
MYINSLGLYSVENDILYVVEVFFEPQQEIIIYLGNRPENIPGLRWSEWERHESNTFIVVDSQGRLYQVIN